MNYWTDRIFLHGLFFLENLECWNEWDNLRLSCSSLGNVGGTASVSMEASHSSTPSEKKTNNKTEQTRQGEFFLFMSASSGDWKVNGQRKSLYKCLMILIFLCKQGIEMLIVVKRKACIGSSLHWEQFFHCLGHSVVFFKEIGLVTLSNIIWDDSKSRK